MTTQRDLERALDAFFAQGADEVADRVIDDALLTIDHTPQRRVLSVRWRPTIMPSFARLAVAAAAIAIVAGGALYVLAPGNETIGGPSAAPSPSAAAPSPTASALALPSAQASVPPPQPLAWERYESARFDYRVEVPVGWTHTNPIDDLPDDLFPGDEIQYADRWDDPVDRSPYLIVAVIDPVPEADSAWLERAVAGLIADCDAADPVTVSVAGTTGERRRVTCTAGLATEIVFFTQSVGSLGRIFMIDSSAGPEDAALASEILDQVLASFTFIVPS